MQRHTPRLLVLTALSALLAAAVAPRATTQGTPIGFSEEFALSTDRAAALAQLIPGTEEDYYYQCLHRQNIGALDQVDALLRNWIKRHGRTSRVVEIENRQALLSYRGNPAGTLGFLVRRLGLSFNHQRQVSGVAPDVPTRLDPSRISPATLTPRALRNHPKTVNGFRDSAFSELLASDLDDNLLMSLLGRLRRPDESNLPALIVRNLGHKQSRGFGSLAIHRNLLLNQLEECVRLRPKLLNEPRFIDVYLRRLTPNDDIQWRRDPSAREAYLDRLQAFAQRLTPAHNSLKAHVLYHRLAHDLALGTPDQERFIAYLQLPRQGHYINPKYLERRRRGEAMVDAAHAFPTGLDAIGNDEPLVRAYFAHYFATADSFEAYTDWVRSDYLRRLFAETKILTGVGDMERWYSLLDDPAYYERIKERVDIQFPPTLPTSFASDELVAIEVDVKNVENLLVKVFEINTLNYFTEQGKAVDASINLDGLVANHETTHTYSEGPLRRVRRRFELPSIDRPGVYVVELIGNGMSSRAVIEKGRLQYVERSGAAGQVFMVLDEKGHHLPRASIWFGGREYAADKDGEIVLPYSTKPGDQPIILRHGDLATLEHFGHRAESYRLTAGIHLDRESLLARRRATVLVRPALLLNGRPANLELLEDPVLTITAIDQNGIRSTQDVRDFALFGDRESEHEIEVPETLQSISVVLRGRVRNLSRNEDVDLASTQRSFRVNGIEKTDATGCPLLGRTAGGYVLDVLGKDGEPKPDHAVQLVLDHRDYTDPISVTLKTDGRGRIQLGALTGIQSIKASGFPGGIGAWQLDDAARTYPQRLHGLAGGTLRVPYQGDAQIATRSIASLLELRNGVYARDANDGVSLAGGFLELRGLAPGDYDLWLPEVGEHIAIHVTAGERRADWAVGRDRLLELTDQTPLHITGVAVVGDEVEIALANAHPGARVHVVATRYMAPFPLFADLRTPGGIAPDMVDVTHSESTYHSGREIGDEYRYILDRRFAAKFPGNMLRRPGLILNPWALDEHETAIGMGGGAGGRFGGRSPGRARRGAGGGPASPGPRGLAPGGFASLEFLPEPSRLLRNLQPDADGIVRVALKDLGPGQLVHVLAADRDHTIYTSLALAEKPLAPVSRRLPRALDADVHFAEQRRIEFVDGGATAVVEDVTTSSVETFDSLGKVFRLFRAISGSGELDTFAFVLGWPKLDDAQKRELYSKHTCHELHFFLYRKDPVFFRDIVRPHLLNKAHKTFLDHWLLDDDLSRYLDPWAFGQLNIVERILLAQRVEGQSDAVARHVSELFDLIPPDTDLAGALFESALKSDALSLASDLDQKLGEVRRKTAFRAEKQEQLRRAGESKAADKRPAPPRAAAGIVAAKELEEAPSDDAISPDATEGKKVAQLSKDMEQRQQVRQLYRAPDPTREYVEHNYWHRRIEEQNAGLIGVNAFWRDYAVARGREPFFSTHVATATGSIAEMMLALAVLDLPFEAGEHTSKIEGTRLVLGAATPLLLVRKEIVEATRADDAAPILVSQNFFRLDEPYRFEGNQRLDAYVTDEFVIDVAYGCRVVVTNPTSAPRKLELLLQIPQGAIPVRNGFYTRGVPVHLDVYGTSSIEFAFYFPAPGRAPHYPAHVARDGALIASAVAITLNVVAEPTRIDTTSWEHVSQNGTKDEVIAYLDGANLQRTDLTKIAWRMRDRAFFATTIDRLRQRHVYNAVLWSYGFRHGDERAVREYLPHADRFLAQCGRYIASPLVTIDPVERRAYQHIDYEPLFNPRAHRFGKQYRILNDGLARQYLALLDILAYRPELDDVDWMTVTYYLLLQDRVETALQSFARVEPTRLPMRLQYDYMRAYLDFFSDEHALARGIADRYRDYPVPHWRTKFEDILGQLDEAEGADVSVTDPESRTQQQTALAATAASLELAVETQRVQLSYRNLEQCQVSYYDMDVEFLFSTRPFVQQDSGSFAYIRPNLTETRTLPPGQKELAFELPAAFRNSNVLVEVRGGGVTRRKAYYANSMAVQMIENYGQLAVTDVRTQKPLPKVYVKVFARVPGGGVRFHKDGYTDLRGRFDYASLSGSGAGNAERYAVLVLSENRGAVIREVAPPTE